MAAGSDDGMQINDALFAGIAILSAVNRHAGFAECPGNGTANIETYGILPVHPVQDATMGIKRQDAGIGVFIRGQCACRGAVTPSAHDR